jgi:RimJ/RimL family protein N-acetyltransferase
MSAVDAGPGYLLRTLTRADAKRICTWRYPPPYDFYNIDESSMQELLDPANHCIAVDDQTGSLLGFFTFGASARVRGASRTGLYQEPALDIGLGMRPDLAGQGHGLAFVDAGLHYSRERFQPVRFRLVVAAFNARAIRVYERAGFQLRASFTSPVRKTEVPFRLMTRSEADRGGEGG